MMFWQQGLGFQEALDGIWGSRWGRDSEEEEGRRRRGRMSQALSQVSCVSLSAIHMTTDIASI